ncbi:MAG: TetR family transcriptional regulator [Propioniciclava sp.]|uniref:TetR family transcriptional regulator n=1 Tax=Propioniciclava sp. TaxID=2038686 RepID=UPI0039E6F604
MSTAPAASRDLGRTRAEILEVATQHFARLGYYGARVDDIASETSTTKRMIYYCFGGKDDLFAACIRAAYAKIRQFEQSLHLDDMAPREAIATYVRGTIRYLEEHAELPLLVRAENLLGAAHLAEEDDALNRQIIDLLDRVLARGRAGGDFRDGVRGVELHMLVTALGNYRITNQPTFHALFGFSTRDSGRLEHDLDEYVRMTLGWLRADADEIPSATH